MNKKSKSNQNAGKRQQALMALALAAALNPGIPWRD